MRVGIGYDVHAFEAGRPLVLGGVRIEHERGLGGHSDADVLTHAVIDALLGAAGLGDIGTHFPSDDPQNKDVSSTELLHLALHAVANAEYAVLNIDATVIVESPRLRSYIDDMRRALAYELNIPMEQVGIKATTADRLGAIGRGEGIAALAVALLDST